MKLFFLSLDVKKKKKNSRLDVVFDEVIHHHVVAELGKVQGCCLVLGEDVAVSSILQ